MQKISKDEKIVYFVRHGQSEDNASPVFQSPDSPLSEKGKRQAQSIAERASRLAFQALVSSPLERAKQTAQIVASATGKQVEFCDLFIERVKPSYINGRAHSDEKAKSLWQEWEKSLYTPGARVEDGENFDDLVMRADKALEFLRKRPEQSLLVVTHGYFLRAMVARVLLSDLLSADAFKNIQKMATVENTGLTVLRYRASFQEKPAWRLWIYNDHAHLAD